MQKFRILTGLRLDPVALVVRQCAARGIVEPRQQRLPDFVELLVVCRHVRIGADLFVARGLRTGAIEGRWHEGSVGHVGNRFLAVGKVAGGELPHIFAVGTFFVAPFGVPEHDAQRLALAAHFYRGRLGFGIGIGGLAGGLLRAPVFVRQHRAGQPRAGGGFYQRAHLAGSAAITAGAVYGAGVEGEPKRTSVRRRYGDAAECVDPFAGKSRMSKTSRDCIQCCGTLA